MEEFVNSVPASTEAYAVPHAGEGQSLDFHERLLDAVEQAVVVTDLGGAVTYWSRYAESLYFYTRQEAVGRNIVDLLMPGEMAAEAEEIMEHLRLGKVWKGDFVVRRKDGTVIPVSVTNSPIYDDQGELTGIVGLSQDISERQRSEASLIESEARYRFLVEHSSDGVHTYNAEGRFLDVNSKFCEMIGYTRDELLNLRVDDLVLPEDLAREPIRFKALSRGQTLLKERRLRRKNGSIFVAEISGRMLRPGLFYGSIRDVSERKRAQTILDAQKQALEMVVSGAPLDAVLLYLTRTVEKLSDGTVVASVLLLDDEKRLHNAASPSLPADYIQAIDGIAADENVGTCCVAAATGRVASTPDISRDPKWVGLSHLPLNLGLVAAWSMPILSRNGRVLGTFGTYFRDTREPDDFERQVIEVFSRTAALAIEQKRASSQLRDSEAQLRLVTDTIPVLVSFVDHELRYRFVNKAYTQWFQHEYDDIVGHHLSEVLGEEAVEALRPEIERALSGERVRFERPVPYRTGERFISVDYIPQLDAENGRVTGFHAFVSDISDRKKAELALQRSNLELEDRVEARTVELRKANEERVQILHELVVAQENERGRMAREIHDQLGQQMTVLRLKLDSIRRQGTASPDLLAKCEEISAIVRQLDADVDFLAWSFRPAVLDDIGLAPALDQYIKQWSEHFQIPASFIPGRFGSTRLDPDVETHFYRTAQEALNNIAKHAAAAEANVMLEPRADGVVLIIEDDGSGFNVDEKLRSESGMGLRSMHERAALIGGTLEIESAQGAGTTIYLRVPKARLAEVNKDE